MFLDTFSAVFSIAASAQLSQQPDQSSGGGGTIGANQLTDPNKVSKLLEPRSIRRTDAETDEQNDGWTNERTEERTNGWWTNKRPIEQAYAWSNWRKNERKQERSDGLKDRRTDERKDARRTDGRIEQIVRWMNNWTDGRTSNRTDNGRIKNAGARLRMIERKN